MTSGRATRFGGVAFAAVTVAISLLLAAPGGAQRAHADGGVQNYPADVVVLNLQYVPDVVHVKHGKNITFGNYDPVFGNPGHSLEEVVKDCSAPPSNDNNAGEGNCGDPRFSSGLVDWSNMGPVHGVDRLTPGTYHFTCQVHPFMRGTLIVDA